MNKVDRDAYIAIALGVATAVLVLVVVIGLTLWVTAVSAETSSALADVLWEVSFAAGAAVEAGEIAALR